MRLEDASTFATGESVFALLPHAVMATLLQTLEKTPDDLFDLVGCIALPATAAIPDA